LISIAVFGSSLPAEGSTAYQEAQELGSEIARRGGRVICGGYGGVMEAACRGAAQGDGSSVGVILRGRGAPNRWVTEAVAAADPSERLRRLRDLADAWIFLPHGLGTMLELVWIAESVVKGDAPPRPLVLLGDFWRPTLETALAEASSPAGVTVLRRCVRFASAPGDAVRLALADDL
jgi:uncharacterized protein (TIGR00730 family)